MSVWGTTPDGRRVPIAEGDIDKAVANGVVIDSDQDVVVRDELGDGTSRYNVEDARRHRSSIVGLKEQADERAAELTEGAYDNLGDRTKAFTENAADALTVGGYSATLRAFDGHHGMARRREHLPGTALAGQIVGSLAPGATVSSGGRLAAVLSKTPMGLIERVALRAGKRIGGTKGAVAREAIVGAGVGAGTGVSTVALSEDPVTLEGALGSISSSMLFGAGLGAAGGVLGKAAEKGIMRAQNALKRRAAGKSAGEALEGGKQFADDVIAHRAATNESKWWLPLKKAGKTNQELKEASAIAMAAEKRMRRILRDPKGLAQNPAFVGRTLREQEQALETTMRHMDELRAAATPDGAHAKALDAVETTLERNRALQQTMAQLDEAKRLASVAKPEGIVEGASKGVIFSGAMGAAAAVDPTGGVLAVPVAAVAARKASSLIFNRLDKAAGHAERRMASALERFLGAAKGRPARAVVPAATRILSQSRFAPESKPWRPIKAVSKIGKAFKERAAEIRSQTVPGPDGRHRMTPSARAAMAGTWASVRQHYPLIADRLEALGARRIEFLADRLPTNPGVPDSMLGGPDSWTPSSTEMRKFARYVAAAEDPAGVLERMATTRMTTEDAETLRELYPETFAAIQLDLVHRLPELRKRLPYKKRLMLSIFTGVPVDPSMNPRVLDTLQAHFKDEEGSEGGTQAPVPQPAFGSISRPEPTPAQSHA